MAFNQDQYDIVLVYPPAEIVLEIYDLPDFPNIGIAYIAAHLEKTLGLRAALIDARFSRMSVEETIERIIQLNPKIVGIGGMTPMVVTVSKISRALKERLPDVSTVLGGFHATFMPERTLKEFAALDYVVVGEGEMAFASLVDNILAGCSSDIKGVWYRTQDGVADNGRGEIPETLDELGEPAWHLYDPEDISTYCGALPVMGQRGCPFSCTFCSRPYGQLVRKRTPALIANEIAANNSRYGVEKFHFYD